MAVTYGFFNSVNGDRKYNAEQMSEYFRGIINEGVYQHLDGGLAVTAGTGLAVNVAAGRAIIQNRWIQNSAAMSLTIAAASETYARKDAVVIRLNWSSRAISIVVKTGTPAASPVAPSMTRNATTYEMALAYVNVAANATSVTVTDKRSDSTVCGWVTVAQSTSGEVDAQLNAMKTGFDGVVYDSPAAATLANNTFFQTEIENSTENHFLTDFSSFLPGAFSISNNIVVYNADTANAKCIFLYNVDHIKIKSVGYKVYLKQIPVSTGIVGDTINLQNSSFESDTKSHYLVSMLTNTSGSLFNLYYHNYVSDQKKEYDSPMFFNGSFSVVKNYNDANYMDIDSTIRVISNKIVCKKISVKCCSDYFANVYVCKNNAISEVASWQKSYSGYDADAQYYIVVVKNYAETSISVSDVRRNVSINIKALSDDPKVVYFTTTVPINGTDYEDHGIVVLPRNYSDDGEPLRLAIVCHGAGAAFYEMQYTTMDDTGKILGDPQRVLTKKGFVVMDCYAAPYDYVGTTASSAGLHFGNPSVVTCYQKAYDYVVNNFNVKKDGILLFGSSMGGLSISQIVRYSAIPILSCVGYCPCTDMFKQAWSNTWASNQRYNISRLFGFEGTAPTWTNGYYNLTEAEKQYFYDNIDKVIGYYPMLYGITTGSFDELKSVFPSSKSGSAPEEKAVYDTFRLSQEVPMKIFHCVNDTTMAERYSEYYVGMLKRNGQLIEFQTYPSGGHAAWAAGDDVTMTDIAGDTFTCKESQRDGFNFAMRFNR